MNITYSAAGERDIEALFRLSKQLIDQYENVDEIDYGKVLQWVRRKIETHIGAYIRVAVNGKTAGYYAFHRDGGKMEIDDLYILPEYRSQGIGTQIIQKCRRETDLPIFLYVFVRNERAIAFYKRQGFRVVQAAGKTRYIMEL